jgi:DNA-binding Lrp family transcriptional regulator
VSQPCFLNKYEKEKRVIELHLAGKTIREIAKEVHMSFTPISNIIKAYERNKELQAKREESNQSNQLRKPSISSQAFILFKEGKQIDEVKVLLDIPFKKAMIFWGQYLKSIRMEDGYQFWKEHSYDIPTFLSIKNFMGRNNVSGKDILQTLREATDVIHLRTEIEKLKQIKNNYLINRNTNYQQLLPLGLPEHYYRY